jgi:hypothetical protein
LDVAGRHDKQKGNDELKRHRYDDEVDPEGARPSPKTCANANGWVGCHQEPPFRMGNVVIVRSCEPRSGRGANTRFGFVRKPGGSRTSRTPGRAGMNHPDPACLGHFRPRRSIATHGRLSPDSVRAGRLPATEGTGQQETPALQNRRSAGREPRIDVFPHLRLT